mgnify:CR=1 FL=1
MQLKENRQWSGNINSYFLTILNIFFLKLLLLEHEALILVFRVPQSVQKVEFRDSLKPLRLFEQQKSLFKSYV